MVATKLEFGLACSRQSGLELLGFCIAELTNNEETLETNVPEVDDLNAHVAALTFEIELLDGSISSAENVFSEITNDLAEATNMRDRRIVFLQLNTSSRSKISSLVVRS